MRGRRDGAGFHQAHWLDRRRALSTLFCAELVGTALSAAEPASAGSIPAPPRPGDEEFMRLAIAEAARGDMPFGAVIVRDGRMVASGRNIGRSANDPTAHGEITAIRNFVAAHPAAELRGATLYTTGEPCPMCMGAILWCGFGRVVFAASIDQLATRLGQIMLSSRTVAEAAPFAKIDITGGVLAAEALALFPPP